MLYVFGSSETALICFGGGRVEGWMDVHPSCFVMGAGGMERGRFASKIDLTALSLKDITSCHEIF